MLYQLSYTPTRPYPPSSARFLIPGETPVVRARRLEKQTPTMSGRTQAYDATAAAFQASSRERSRREAVHGGMSQNHDAQYNRDQDQKPGAPRPATEPHGAEGSARSDKTLTDPASGEPRQDGHAPNQADTDLLDGAEGGRKAAQDRNLPRR